MTEPVLYTCEFIGLDVCNELTIAKSEIERLKAENEQLKAQVDEYKFDSDCLRDIVDRMER